MPRIPRPRLAPAVAVGVAIALVALWLAETLPVEAGLVGWDEACFYKAAQDLYMSLAGGDVVGFLRDIRSQSFYPPGHALVSAAWFSIAGPSLWSFSLLTVLVFAAVVGLSWSVGRRLGAEWAGLAVALLVAGSPLVQVLAARPLLEVRGLALTLAFV
ncbi:MAG TPA: glycosyltransferase family 39 protein, partial [Thermodesulfobacteriota bacterium]